MWYRLRTLSWHDLKEFHLKVWRDKARRKFQPSYGQEYGPRPPVGRFPRPRRLSVCDNSPGRKYIPQDDCIFFSKLPLELRRAIYQLILGNRLVHLGRYYDHQFLDTPAGLIFPDVEFQRYFCREHNDVDAWNHPCWWPIGIKSRPKDPEEKLLSLLLVCRRV